MKRASIFIPGILILCLQSLYAGQGGSNLNGSPQAKGVPTSSNAQLSLTLQDVIHSSTVIAPGIRALSWRPGTKQLTFLRPPGNGGPYTLSAYDVESHRETVLFDSAAGKQQLDLHSYQWSPRGDVILLEGDNDLWLLDPQTHGLRRLTHDGVAKEVPAFSPAGDRIAFVEKHDLYVVDAKSGAVRLLSHDGSDTIYNGRLDWVYEEELANRASGRAFEWSPDGKRIAYLRLDDAPVPDYPITDFLATHVTLEHERFPQAGDRNPLPSLRVAAVDEPSAPPARLALDPRQVEYFGPNFTWTPDGAALCFLAINRAQTDVAVHRWTPRTGNDRVLLTEHDPYWVNSVEVPYFLKGGRQFLWVSERDGWQHVYLYTAEGKLVRQITRGAWMLDRPLFGDEPLFQLDPQENWLYFASTNPDPRERQLYRIHLDGSGMERITAESGSHTLDLSPDGRYLVGSLLDVRCAARDPSAEFERSAGGHDRRPLKSPGRIRFGQAGVCGGESAGRSHVICPTPETRGL